MNDEIPEAGRAAVRTILIEPLEAEGMRMKRGTSPEDTATYRDRLQSRLAYCSEKTLANLVPTVRAMAEGKGKNVWPALITITNLARQLQAPPDRSDEILYSWFHSQAGVRARNEGTELAEYAYIKKFRTVPSGHPNNKEGIRLKLREAARDAEREIEQIRRAMSNGEASEDELHWLRWQHEILATVNAIIDAGINYRAAKAKGEEAAA